SDFVGTMTSKNLSIAAKKHDIIGIQIFDEAERILPQVGLIKVKDSETGTYSWIDTNKASERLKLCSMFDQQMQYTKDTFTKSNADLLSINVKDDYVKTLQNFFSTRVNAR